MNARLRSAFLQSLGYARKPITLEFMVAADIDSGNCASKISDPSKSVLFGGDVTSQNDQICIELRDDGGTELMVQVAKHSDSHNWPWHWVL
ncbi:MAG: hypothetical protein AAF226_08145 [Verrucomicrobiota bacterium]